MSLNAEVIAAIDYLRAVIGWREEIDETIRNQFMVLVKFLDKQINK